MRRPGQFYTAQIYVDGKWVHRTFFPSDWTEQEVDELLAEMWKRKELVAICNDYIVFQAHLHGRINIRFIADLVTEEVLYYYPMFDIPVPVIEQEEKISLLDRLKNKMRAFLYEEEKIEMTEIMKEDLKNQLLMEFRRVVLTNKMNRGIKVTFVLEVDGQETIDEHYMGANDGGQMPFFTPGTLTVWHEHHSVSTDISDVKKEYAFTVHEDGSLTVLVNNDGEKGLHT